MSQSNSNSYLTIAAACSTDDIEGFLGMRSECLQVDVDSSLGRGKIFVAPLLHEGFWTSDIGKLNEMPLNMRAWTLRSVICLDVCYTSARTKHLGKQATASWASEEFLKGEAWQLGFTPSRP